MTELIETLKKVPATAARALAKVQGELDAVEAKIASVEEKLVNASDLFKAARAEWERLQSNWDSAIEAMDSDETARLRAEAVRAVIEKIIVRFRPTGRRRPAYEVDSIQMIPKDAKDYAGAGTSPPATRNRSMS
jgi:hypothetical protein